MPATALCEGGTPPSPSPQRTPARLWSHAAGSLSHSLVAILLWVTHEGAGHVCCLLHFRGEGEGGAPPSQSRPRVAAPANFCLCLPNNMLAWAISFLDPLPEKPWERTRFLRDAVLMARIAYFGPAKMQRLYEGEAGSVGEEAECELLRACPEPPVFCDSPVADSQAFVMRYMEDAVTEHVVLACRGTSSLLDVMCDSDLRLAPLTEFPGAMVHTGFLGQFRALAPLFDQHLDLLGKEKRLLCVGHSLGAGVAAIAALVYARRFPGRVDYVGCGSPRVGDLAFKVAFDREVGLRHRLVHARDPIAKVPLAFRFAHVGDRLHYGRRDFYPTLPALTDLGDHMQWNYVKDYDEPRRGGGGLVVAIGGLMLELVHRCLLLFVSRGAAQRL